ncbi:orotidine-5'-phosphate decarboxylase [Bauldia sp.]|uniref:orotidine-5'-phosphate decarboxylase n=1 Tax=Bauldia sp. TaxID=2575872 RepID=UPI003BA98608
MPLIPARDRLVVALDLADVATAEKMVEQLNDSVGFYKVGLQLIYANGLDFVRSLTAAGYKVFLDAKILDIDNTVAKAIESIKHLGVTFVTVHAYPKAMRAAVAARGDADLRLLGVTVLTSMDDGDLIEAGYADTSAQLVAARATFARDIGMDGVVASPTEAAAVRRIVGTEMAIVTPGVRPAGAATGDQKRVATPRDAIRAGADYLVVGRPITGDADPKAAADAIVDEIAEALKGEDA